MDTASRLPIYRQLAEQIREGIATGKLAVEEKLPSVRDLAARLVVNPNTIAKVYAELERVGVLTTRQGLGVFVASPRGDLTKKARTDRLNLAVDRLLTEAVHLGFTSKEVADVVANRAERFQWEAGSK